MKLSSIITLLSTPSLALSLGFPNTRKEFQLTDNGSMEHLYARYKLYFNKIYNPSEDPAHSAIFTSTVENVFDWNEANHSYSKGINIFSDMDTHSKKQYIMTETYVDVVQYAALYYTYLPIILLLCGSISRRHLEAPMRNRNRSIYLV